MRRTFRVKSVTRQLGPLIVTSMVTVGILFAITEPEGRVAVAIVGAVLLFAIVFAGWLVTRTRLEVSAEGITYHAIGYRVVGRWEDVAGHGKRVMGASDIESLILRQPGIELSGWVAFAYRLLPAASVVALLGGRVPEPGGLGDVGDAIPVGMFDKDWRTGEIGSAIRSYAPEAFETQVR